jgi:hypothetical protein
MGMEGFAMRLRKAFRAYEDRVGRDITQTELGEMVGVELARMGVKPTSKDDTLAVTQQSVARWFAGTLPEHTRMVALATVLGVDPGWLSYGSGEDEGGQGSEKPSGTPVQPPPAHQPPPPKRTPPPLQEPEVLETRWIRPRKKAKRRPGDRSAVA